MAAFEAWLVLLLVVNVVGELQQKRTLAASRGFLAAARLSCSTYLPIHYELVVEVHREILTIIKNTHYHAIVIAVYFLHWRFFLVLVSS